MFKILHIEDNLVIADSIRRFLTDNLENISITHCATIRGAKEKLNKETFDIIICDGRIETHDVSDGLAAATEFKKNGRPVVLLTGGLREEEDALAALNEILVFLKETEGRDKLLEHIKQLVTTK